MNRLNEFIPLLSCPQCDFEGPLVLGDEVLICSSCNSCYPIIHGRPTLFRNDNNVFQIKSYLNAPPPTVHSKYNISRYIPSPSVNLSRSRVLLRLRNLICASPGKKVLVVGGGRQRSSLDKILVGDGKIQVFYCDVDIRADIDVFCDAHDLPFVKESFDAVITTAVLEHVLYPELVAREITRVLKTGGVLYSELPFMQQVHEGAYDFTRYTFSGHRRLLNRFEEIDGGIVAGPATALVWSIENFALAFFNNKINRSIIKCIVRIIFFWIKYFDYLLINSEQAMDAASCTYLLCRKIEGTIADVNIIERYVGAKPLKHT